jgi:bifunctional DNA-binding transcriptional regulator/antitoxin component of YhaV-PrlF toxin-antitoxin module
VDPSAAKITASGQVSLPATLRRRWGASTVLVIDKGNYAIVRPLPDDPVAAVMGSHAVPGPSAEDARSRTRDEDAEREDGRRR